MFVVSFVSRPSFGDFGFSLWLMCIQGMTQTFSVMTPLDDESELKAQVEVSASGFASFCRNVHLHSWILPTAGLPVTLKPERGIRL